MDRSPAGRGARAHRRGAPRVLRAGAVVATSASYQASVEGLVAAGCDAAEAQRLITLSVTLAREVRRQPSWTPPRLLVAASVGPAGAFLADGSEYTGRYGVSSARLRDFHAPRLELLAAAGPDLLAVETIPDVARPRFWSRCWTTSTCPPGSATCARRRDQRRQPLAEAYAVLTGSRSPSLRASTAPTRPMCWVPSARRRRHGASCRRLPQSGRQLGQRPQDVGVRRPSRSRSRRDLGGRRRTVHRRLLWNWSGRRGRPGRTPGRPGTPRTRRAFRAAERVTPGVRIAPAPHGCQESDGGTSTKVHYRFRAAMGPLEHDSIKRDDEP